MAFSPEFIERVRSANDLSQIAASYNIHLKRVGSNQVGLCPFHNEKTPSFSVRDQFFRCFGCDAKGDIFKFVQMIERVEFPEAIRFLAERAGIPLEYENPAAALEERKRGRIKSSLLECCSLALEFFEENLRNPGGRVARDYLLERGFTAETIQHWRLGWAPDSFDGLCGFLLKNSKEPSAKEKVLEYGRQAGLLKEGRQRQDGRPSYYDLFRGRVMFPILDSQSRPVGFGGRILTDDKEAPKYVNSPEGKLFEKRKILFGLNQAGRGISQTGSVVLVEGYVDVIMCHQFGITNVVGVLGTSLTADHLTTLRRFLPEKGRVIAFFDSDKSGQAAARRAIDMFMEQDLPLSVAGDLEVKDAGDFLPRFGADAFRDKLAEAEDSFGYLVKRLVGPAKTQDLSTLGLAIREMMRTVNLCPDPVKRAIMRQRVAAEAGVPEETLPTPVEKTPAGLQRSAARIAARPSKKHGLAPPTAGLEMEDALRRTDDARRRREARLLRYMWDSPEWCARVADDYPPDEWHDAALAELAALARDDWDENRSPAIDAARTRVRHPDAADRLADLAFPDEEPLSEKELSRLLDLVRDETVKEEIRLLLGQMEEAQKKGDADLEARLLAEYTRLQAERKKGR